MALTAGYEAVREMSRRYEERLASKMEGAPLLCRGSVAYAIVHEGNGTLNLAGERGSLLGFSGSAVQAEEQKGKVVKAALYGIQVFYSFFIMLLFMTYNGWIMIAVGVGAFLGYLVFGGGSIQKSAACH
ncbi:copper transpport protein [Recurvomyces mirabilis]|nr:copper transpport protein [Recurvomyces mirabilis]